MENWIECCKSNNDLVLSSRIRLARNVNKRPFPHMLKEGEGREIVKLVEDAFYSSSFSSQSYKTSYLWERSNISNEVSLEKHLISKNLIDNSNKAAFILDKDETVSIMINEEDHVRIQCITSSLNLEEAYDFADKIDNLLEEKLDYAFDEKLGYLTACPTNIGTGMRASVMIHLPTLSLSNKLNNMLSAVTQLGMTIRGLYGEGSKGKSNIYQVSNQTTLGLSEEEIINNLKAVIIQIVNEENLCRNTLINKYRYEIEDKIYRALGVLKSAVILNSNECLKLLSDVRLGIEMGIIKDVDKISLNNILVNTQTASIYEMYNGKLSDKETNFNRAKIVREILKKETL
ncbi:protein arginine kinase [Clostridium drakei]|uniref:Protein-arginine kinase n=1 Tax=Clostridium drakei TaxID=332101 RepID=A0A2U8DXL0_9CLOT|nr:protein arginine kinase [Clostridium drakei]AWI07370.1 ATP--guanido phosphotransferase [Clostridium drakei]